MAYSDIAISTHDGEKDRACELVDAGCRHVRLAHDVSERPRLSAHRGDQKGNADQKALVRDGQVYDVQIGDCLHLGEANYHVDDERVA